MIKLFNGDNKNIMQQMVDKGVQVDCIVTDPPYGLSFMGKKWDYDVPDIETWELALKLLKPGGYLLSFCGTRTQHRMAVNIEDGGFEIRDMIAWVYGSGFPKSHNISKAIDKQAGATREVIGVSKNGAGASPSKINNHEKGCTGIGMLDGSGKEFNITAPSTLEAQQWDGWGTGLKPALEPITMARKPLEEKTIASNVLKYGTGGINIDASRVPSGDKPRSGNVEMSDCDNLAYGTGWQKSGTTPETGRFPANFIHDGSDEVEALFPFTKTGDTKSIPYTNTDGKNVYGKQTGIKKAMKGDSGSASRFFYCAKTSKKDRNEGMTEDLNNHPTVKPTQLMRYLVKMVCPEGGIVLDPFMGSGSTGKACKLEGFNFIGIELDEDYFKIAQARIDAVEKDTNEQ